MILVRFFCVVFVILNWLIPKVRKTSHVDNIAICWKQFMPAKHWDELKGEDGTCYPMFSMTNPYLIEIASKLSINDSKK